MSTEINNKIFLGMGGNLGNPLDCFREARRQLSRHPQINLIESSALYRTPAIGGPSEQPDYLNAVLEISTNLIPRHLLKFCQEIETSCGRTREIRWAPRTLDIDLLFWGDEICDDLDLILPHPRLQSRHFVLLPLADLDPEWRHPRLNKSVTELLKDLPEPADIIKLSENW